MKKIRLVYNKSAGQNRFREYLDEIIGMFCERGFEVSVFRASKENSLEEYIKDTPEDTYGIVIAGGDGTINKAVNAMMKNNIKVPLGIIPAGTSNDFAKHINMPADYIESVEKILKWNIEDVDVGKVNDSYFINVLSAGLYASTSYKTDKRLKDTFGQLSYFLTAATQTFKYIPIEIKIETGNAVIVEKAAVFIIFNGSSVGRINKFSDESSVQDGMLDMVIIRDCKFNELLRLAGEIQDRTFLSDENVVYLREAKFKITKLEGKCDKPDVDGDEGPDFPLNVECIEKGLKMFL